MTKDAIRKQFPLTMQEIANKDKRLFVIVGDISHGIFSEYRKKIKNRYTNLGILEPTMISLSAGMSKTGFIPVVHTIAPFLIERSYEQIKLDFCYHKLPGLIVSVGGAFDYSALGCTHHSYNDLSIMKSFQNTEVYTPSSPLEFDVLVKKTYKNKYLKYFKIPKNDHEKNFDKKQIIPGKSIKIRSGKDLSIFVVGTQLKNAILLESKLKKEGIICDLIYFHTLKPLDKNSIIKSIRKTKKFITIEEHSKIGSFGDDVRRLVNFNYYKNLSFTLPDEFIHYYGSYNEICEKIGLNVDNYFRKIIKLFK